MLNFQRYLVAPSKLFHSLSAWLLSSKFIDFSYLVLVAIFVIAAGRVGAAVKAQEAIHECLLGSVSARSGAPECARKIIGAQGQYLVVASAVIDVTFLAKTQDIQHLDDWCALSREAVKAYYKRDFLSAAEQSLWTSREEEQKLKIWKSACSKTSVSFLSWGRKYGFI